MRAETQADRLERLFNARKVYPEYRLTFGPFEIKKSALKSLETGDVFLLGASTQELVLLRESTVCARVMLEESAKGIRIRVISTLRESLKNDTKKYQRVEVVLGLLQSRKLELDHTIEAKDIRLDRLDIVVNGEKIAQGSLVKIDGETAVQIDKVET